MIPYLYYIMHEKSLLILKKYPHLFVPFCIVNRYGESILQSSTVDWNKSTTIALDINNGFFLDFGMGFS